MENSSTRMMPHAVLALFGRLPTDYQQLLEPFFRDQQRWPFLEKLVLTEHAERLHQTIFPAEESVFRALFETPLQSVRVVLLGQDPYHSPGLAQGLAFSIPANINPHSRAYPSSLRNISKALVLDGYDPLPNGDLSLWAKQGVLLLNTVLTVPQGLPGGHQAIGWQFFTDALLQELSKHHDRLAWLLWGSAAHKKIPMIISNPSHLILTASHPSGLGAYQTDQPFLSKGDQSACGHFQRTNAWLSAYGQAPILWSSSLL